MTYNTTVTLGADPELFFVDPTTGDFVSAYGLVEGTKEVPFPTEFGAVQLDGNAIEFNITPCLYVDDFVDRLKAGVNYCASIAERNGLVLSFSPVANFRESYFKTLPEQCFILGCSPDWNGKTGEVNAGPAIGYHPIRTSSGHVHIGWGDGEDTEFWAGPDRAKRLALVQHLGPIYDKISKKWENALSDERRNYYGYDWSFRLRTYGVEMRQLDALWLTREDFMCEVFTTTQSETVKFLDSYNKQEQKVA